MLNHLKHLLAQVLGAFFLMADAFYNKYPLFYSDSHTYIDSGFGFWFPGDRPITYGLFVRTFSFNGFSMWLAIFFQCFILSYLIFSTVKVLLGVKKTIPYGLLITFIVSFFTGISWTASQVLTDVFTSIAILALFVLLFDNDLKLSKRILLYTIYFIAVCMHMSHIVLFICLFLIIVLLRNWLFAKQELSRKWVHLVILLTLTISAEFPMRPSLDKSKYIIFMGAMVEQGITKTYLDEYCGTKNYRLCRYKDSLPNDCSSFLWSPSSPFYKIGGWTDAGVREEFTDITYATLTTPKYIWLHIKSSLYVTWRQLLSFDIGDGNGSFTDTNSINASEIKKYFHKELPTYLNSQQNHDHYWGINFVIPFYRYIELAFLIVFVILLMFFRSVFSGPFKAATIIFLSAALISDWDLPTFSCVANRFGSKVSWLLPFIVLIALFQLYERRKNLPR